MSIRALMAALPLLCCITGATDVPAFAAEPAALSREQRTRVVQLLADFRRARSDVEKQGAIVDEIIGIGSPAPAAFLPSVTDRDMILRRCGRSRSPASGQ